MRWPRGLISIPGWWHDLPSLQVRERCPQGLRGSRSGVLCSPTIWDSGGDNLPRQPGWCEEAPLVATET